MKQAQEIYLSSTTRQVLKQIWFFSQNEQHQTIFKNLTNFSKRCGYSLRTVQRAVKLLHEIGFVETRTVVNRQRRFFVTNLGMKYKALWNINPKKNDVEKCHINLKKF